MIMHQRAKLRGIKPSDHERRLRDVERTAGGESDQQSRTVLGLAGKKS